MTMKNLELSATVEYALRSVARRHDDLFKDGVAESLKRMKPPLKKPAKPSQHAEKRFKTILSQLPSGIYTQIGQVVNIIEGTKKRNEQTSVSYSPIVSIHSEFDCCKVMKYQQGHVITGRDKEIEKILLTLCKESKRGVVLVGEAGTGKTAIVNAINARLIERTVPRQLVGAQIFNLDIPYVFSKFKEDPLGKIIKVLERASSYDKAILFIDEVHQLLGHKMNDVMKPYLTEKIRFIGSTTVNEYHAIITEDGALERRFTLVPVVEPSVTQTIEMVKGTKSTFEEQHKCTIPDSICEYLVVNGSRFLGHRRNPDKSLDLLDLACVFMDDSEVFSSHKTGKRGEDYFKNLEIPKDEIKSLSLEPGSRVLDKHYVNQAISSVTDIPYHEIKNSLEYSQVCTDLKNKVFGQDDGIDSLANVVNIFKHVKHDRDRPVSVLLLVGPTGCGKRTSAQQLAKNLYGRDDAFIEYDMSGMTSEFMITELKGSPPGYVGYGKSGGLIKAIRNKPQSVVYFREINRADQSIIQYIINACRHGKITDSAEREASLTNAVIVFSVKLSDDEEKKVFGGKSKSMGFTKSEENEEKTNLDAVKNVVGKDIFEACDETILYTKLERATLKMIFDKNLPQYTDMYDVDIDVEKLEQEVLDNAKNGHDVISKLTSEVPKMVFSKLRKEKVDGKK